VPAWLFICYAPSNEGNCIVHTPVPQHSDCAGSYAGRNARNADGPEPARLGEVDDRRARNQECYRRSQIRQECSLVSQQSTIDRKLVTQDQVIVIESGIRCILHISFSSAEESGYVAGKVIL